MDDQMAALPAKFVFDCILQVHDQVKPVGYLACLRCSAECPPRVQSEPITADNLYGRVLMQP